MRQKRLQSVAHNTMDHAVSGLGFLTPHVVEFFAVSDQRKLSVNLLVDDPLAGSGPLSQPLTTALQSCRQRFLEILASEGFSPAILTAARLEFANLDGADFTCECALESTEGARYSASMNSKTYWMHARKDPWEAIRRLRGAG